MKESLDDGIGNGGIYKQGQFTQGGTLASDDLGLYQVSPGKAFIIDTANKHMIHNDSDQPRLHIILHTDIDDKVIERSYANCYYS